MSNQTRSVIETHWALANARRWEEFAQLLHSDLRYEVPQTREHIESGQGYLEMFRTWPGDWRATVKQLVCEAATAVCVIDFEVDGEIMIGISVFKLDGDQIVGVTDYWPAPYEPPPRATPYLQRDPR